jgi:hypothetical protein
VEGAGYEMGDGGVEGSAYAGTAKKERLSWKESRHGGGDAIVDSDYVVAQRSGEPEEELYRLGLLLCRLLCDTATSSGFVSHRNVTQAEHKLCSAPPEVLHQSASCAGVKSSSLGIYSGIGDAV